jgi:hypothetical protein
MRRTAQIDPEEYVLSALSPEARLDAALRVAKAAFRGSKLTLKDVDDAAREKETPLWRIAQGLGSSLTPAFSSPRSRSVARQRVPFASFS